VNILVDALPTAVLIGGQSVPIRTDFRDCLRVILAFEDPDLTPTEQTLILLDNLYSDEPPNLEQAVRQGVKFLNCGELSDDGDPVSEARVYGFAHDASLIFAAFQQTHGIDLQTVADLHWWKFVALFMDLGSDTAFCQLVGLRKRVQSGKATPDERKAARDMGDLFEVPEPDLRTPDERARAEEFVRIARETEAKRREARRQKQADS
jgi:hypothetical protein